MVVDLEELACWGETKMMKHSISCVLLFIGALSWSAPADAQGQWFMGNAGTGAGGLGYSGYGSGFGGGGGGYGLGYLDAFAGYGGYGGVGSDPYAAEYTGMANLVRAQGAYNADTAKAMISYEQARSQYMENQRNFMSAHLSRLRLAKAEETKSHEDSVASQAKFDQYTASQRPHPLSQSQIDPSTGSIKWPELLTAKSFEIPRQALEKMFEIKAKNGSSPELAKQISQAAGDMKDLLRAQILTVPLTDYSESRRFLDSLAVSTH